MDDSRSAGCTTLDRVDAELEDPCRAAIADAVGELWPSEPVPLGTRVPALRHQVHRLTSPAGRAMFVKADPAGAADNAAAGRLQRQGRQLRALRGSGVAVASPSYNRGRVLLSAATAGETFSSRLVTGQAGRDDLPAIWAALSALHNPNRPSPSDDRCLTLAWPRTFGPWRSRLAEAPVGRAWFGPAARTALQSELGELADAVARAASGGEDLPMANESGLAYGALDPDHITIGPSRPVLCSPRLTSASSLVDLAVLLSRSSILAVAAGGPAAGQIGRLIGEFIDTGDAVIAGLDPTEWLRRLMVLWLMDSLTLTADCLLVAKDPLALPAHLDAVDLWAPRVLAVAATITSALRRGPHVALDLGLDALAKQA